MAQFVISSVAIIREKVYNKLNRKTNGKAVERRRRKAMRACTVLDGSQL